jgi:hypothetical protein
MRGTGGHWGPNAATGFPGHLCALCEGSGRPTIVRMHPIVSSGALRALFLVLPLGADSAAPPHLDPVIRDAARGLSLPVNDIRVLSTGQVREIFHRAGGGAPPAGLIAFRIKGDPLIYVHAESEVYRSAADRPSPFHLLRLAATLVHEQVHDSDGEPAAYRRQADFVRSRLPELPADQRARAHIYWHALEVRAISMAKASAAHRRRTASR